MGSLRRDRPRERVTVGVGGVEREAEPGRGAVLVHGDVRGGPLGDDRGVVVDVEPGRGRRRALRRGQAFTIVRGRDRAADPLGAVGSGEGVGGGGRAHDVCRIGPLVIVRALPLESVAQRARDEIDIVVPRAGGRGEHFSCVSGPADGGYGCVHGGVVSGVDRDVDGDGVGAAGTVVHPDAETVRTVPVRIGRVADRLRRARARGLGCPVAGL